MDNNFSFLHELFIPGLIIISQIKVKISTFNEKNLPNSLRDIPAIKPGSRNLSK